MSVIVSTMVWIGGIDFHAIVSVAYNRIGFDSNNQNANEETC